MDDRNIKTLAADGASAPAAEEAGTNVLADEFRAFAKTICATQGLDLDLDRVLFVMDRISPARRNGSMTARIPPAMSDVVRQFTGRRYDFVIKLWENNFTGLGEAGVMGMLYHELRHLSRDPKSGEMVFNPSHDVEDWAELAAYGDWRRNGAKIPNALDDKIYPGPKVVEAAAEPAALKEKEAV